MKRRNQIYFGSVKNWINIKENFLEVVYIYYLAVIQYISLDFLYIIVQVLHKFSIENVIYILSCNTQLSFNTHLL